METTITSTQIKTCNPMLRVMAFSNFRRLWLGQATSLLGDQFHIVRDSWLVLKMTGDPLALGGILATGGSTRAIFTPIGRAVSDRFSPRRLLLAALLAAQILTGTMQVWKLPELSCVGVWSPSTWRAEVCCWPVPFFCL